MKKLATWLAIAAMALQALWPLIAQARPSYLVPVCSLGGVTHYVELPDGVPGHPPAAKHCPLCVVGASPAVAAAAPAVPLRVARSEPAVASDRGAAVFLEVPESPARPRAPPLSR